MGFGLGLGLRLVNLTNALQCFIDDGTMKLKGVSSLGTKKWACCELLTSEVQKGFLWTPKIGRKLVLGKKPMKICSQIVRRLFILRKKFKICQIEHFLLVCVCYYRLYHFNPVQFMSLFGHALFNYNPPKQGRKVW